MEAADQGQPTTVFAAPVQTGDGLIERIRRDLERDFTGGLPAGVDLTTVARGAVAGFTGARVQAFLPVLALRAAREALSATGVDPTRS